MATTTTTKSLATMTATERLAFYREAAKQARPADVKVTLAERAGMLAASVGNFGTDVKATYNYHRYQ